MASALHLQRIMHEYENNDRIVFTMNATAEFAGYCYT